MPFEGKCPSMAFKGRSMAKALRWKRQGHFEGKGPTMEKAMMANARRRQRPFDGKGKGTLKATAIRW
jgi:hypothetical protein